MSQFFIGVTAGSLPPTVPTSFTTDFQGTGTTTTGTAVPVANNLEIRARDNSVNDDDGIRTTADPNGGKIVYVELSNRISGATTTTSASSNSQNILDLGSTPGTYTMWGKVVAYNVTSALGASWDLEATVRTNGAAGVEIAVEVKNGRLEGAMSGAVVSAGIGIGPNANFFTITIQGYNTDTIDWNLLVEYRFVS